MSSTPEAVATSEQNRATRHRKGETFGDRVREGILLLLVLCAPPAHAQDSTRHDVKIEPQPIGAALKALATQTGLQVLVFSQDVGNKRSPAVQGNLTNDEALSRILDDSGLTYQKIDDNTVAIRKGGAKPASAPALYPTSDEQADSTPRLAQSGGLSASDPPQAQQTTSGASPENPDYQLQEVLVTARKREESILKVPVIESVVSTEQIEHLQVNDLADVATLVPGLDVGKSILALGTQISLRGIGTTAYDQGVDSSVSLNVDGLGMSNGLAMQSGMFDLAQIEVLKGPQSLYYGKNNTAGVIAITTADPTDKPELIARAAYEFEAVNPLAELIISGPLTDTLKARLAGQYSFQEGYFFNDATALPGTGAVTPAYSRAPHGHSYDGRLTVLWDPFSQFKARLKVNLVGDYYNNEDVEEAKSCPSGTIGPSGIPFFFPGEKCGLGRTFWSTGLNPQNYAGLLGNGVPFTGSYQDYGSLELTYLPSKDLTLTSVTGYYHVDAQAEVNAFGTSYAGPTIGASNFYARRDFTEEVRLDSDFATPVNYMIAGYYEDGALTENTGTQGDTAYGLPSPLQQGHDVINIKTYSGTGQLRWKIVPQLELTAGARYDDETRYQTPFNVLTEMPVSVPVAQIKSDTWSPEVTLTYTPTDTLTWFAAYKVGYKSGSFSVDTPVTPGEPNSFGDEKVHGGELGLKSLLLDRRLAFNIAPYYYIYDDLQIGIVANSSLGESVNKVVNGAEATTYGLDVDTAYRLETIPGLNLHAALNWNHARWGSLTNVPCYSGQTIAMGCTEALDPATGLYTAQNLTGTGLIRAPDWSVQFGLQYDFRMASNYKLILNQNSEFSSRYETFVATDVPYNANYQGSFIKLDLGLTLQSPNDHWEFALLTKDLNDKITTGNCALSNQSNEILGGSVEGGTTSGPAGVGITACFPDVGRQVWLRATWKPW